MTIASKLQKILEIKNNIKQALINKGVDVSDNFENFAEKIESIQGGESNNLPAGIAGLCCWFDAQYNTINGLDRSKTYIESLIPASRNALKGYSYGNASLNSWDGDLLNLNSTLVIECPVQTLPITVEFVGQTNLTAIAYILKTLYSSKGFQIYANTNGTDKYLDIQVLDTAKNYNTIRSRQIEANKTFYCMASIDPSTNTIRLKLNDEIQEATLKANFAPVTSDMFSGCNIYTPSSSIPSSTGYKQNVMKVGLFRVWNRLLTDEEIQANYQEAKTRFGV